MSANVIEYAVLGQRDQPVSSLKPLPVVGLTASGGATSNTDGSMNVGGANGTSVASTSNPVPVAAAQNVPVFSLITVVAAVAGDLLTADATRHGARLLNYTAAPIYFWPTVNGATPPTGAPADVVPAAAAGLPGQYEFPYAPVAAYRYVGASAGATVAGLGVEVW